MTTIAPSLAGSPIVDRLSGNYCLGMASSQQWREIRRLRPVQQQEDKV